MKLRGLLLFALSLAAGVTASAAKVFRAGAAVGDITPELGSIIIGGFSPSPARDVHDPLQVRTLVLDDGERRLALVVCDNIGLPREVCDAAKQLVNKRCGLAPASILISATHTHSAPTAGTETSIGPNPGRGPADIAAYQRQIATRIADTIEIAVARLELARIGWGRGRVPGQVFNRRWHVTDEALRRNPFGGVDLVRMNPPPASLALTQPAGPVDPEVPFISVQARDGRPLALFAVYSLHYVGGVPQGVMSADYFAVFCARIGELLNAGRRSDPLAPPFVGLLANGTSGDVNNIDFRKRRAPQPAFEQMNRVANEVAAEVFRASQLIEYREHVELDVRLATPEVASRRPTAEMVAGARELLARPTGGPGWHPLEKAYAQRVLQRAEAPATVLAPLQALRIGDALVLSLPVEAFAALGLDLKARAPFAQTLVVGLANGYLGYLPTPDQVPLGGYETWIGTNRLDPASGPVMADALLRFADEMRPRP